eukprot:superscaffoldBa00000612_g6056
MQVADRADVSRSWENAHRDVACYFHAHGGCVQLCGAQDLTCTVTQVGDCTVYNISDVPRASAVNCHYSWTNETKHVLANQIEETAGLVTRNSINVLITSECFDKITLTRSCISETTELTAFCTANCSVMMKINEDKTKVQKQAMSYTWIALVVAAIVTLALVVFVLYCRFREKRHWALKGMESDFTGKEVVGNAHAKRKPGGDEGTLPHTLKYEGILLNLGPSFDFDVDDIMCLSPLGTSSAGGLSDRSESGKNPSSNTFQNEPLSIPSVAEGQELSRGDGDVMEGREELKKDVHLNVQDEEEDKGYFSMSYLKDCKRVNPQLSPATSSPMLRIGEVKVAEDDCHPESSAESGCHTQAVLHGPRVSFTVSDLCPTVSGLPSEPVISPVEALEGDVEEAWTIGPPMFESSVCHNVTVKLDAGSEQSRQVSEEVHGGVIEPLHKCQTTLSGEETTLDTSYETTLPLQVQVKSVVVAPNQLTSSSKPVASPLPDQNTKPAKPSPNKNRVSQTAKCSARSLRPVIFKREADWQHEKSLYVSSVTRHMNERSSAAPDVMTELLKLMTDVADQTPGAMGKQWQHPSDLTRRNYQRRFGNMVPKMSLHEWQAKNCTAHKRFAKVPKIFERSPFP